MDYTTIGGILGIISIVIVVIDKTIALVNHKRVRSNCCGKIAQASFDVENTTPPSEKPLVEKVG